MTCSSTTQPPRQVVRHFDQQHFVFSFTELLKDFSNVRLSEGTPERFKRDYLLESLKDKYPVGEFALSNDERRAAGLQKLLAANAHCKKINDEGYITSVVDRNTLSSVIQVAANKARAILGSFSYDVYKHSAFSNGATTCRSYKYRDPYFKYSNRGRPIEVSGRALSRLRSLINCTPLWCAAGGADNIMINNMDKVTFVPKNGTEDRAIVPQQGGMVLLQKGLAYELKRCLRRVGIDLSDQSRNQKLAMQSSISRCNATMDLKNASALMNYRIVWDIIPPAWFTELDVLRNTHGTVGFDGEPIEWNMFSSMGNGYNFELESLLFFVLASAACEFLGDYVGSISVYGDDIIVPTSCAPFVMDVLEAVGFMINRKKTHISGHFRESCGAHYLNGVDVKPFYIKSEVKTLADVIRIANRIREWSSVPAIRSCDPTYFHIWQKYARVVPKYLRGGQNTAVDYALVTHESPRYRLKNKTIIRPIHGYQALLRHWQGQTHEMKVLRSNLISSFDTGSDGGLPAHLSQTDESVFLVSRNTDQAGELSLFPQEVHLKDVPLRTRVKIIEKRPLPKAFLRDLEHRYLDL